MEPLAALRRQEPEAIDWLVDSFSDRLLKAATLMLGEEQLAEDAVQETLLAALAALEQFRGDSSVYTWLYTILVRNCQRMRRQKLGVRLLDLSSEVIDNFLFQRGNFQGASAVSDSMPVREALQRLSYKDREVLVLFYYEDLPIKEIAALLQTPQGTIKNRLHRARLRLKPLLKGESDVHTQEIGS